MVWRAGLSCVTSRKKETKLPMALLVSQVFQLPLIHGHREGKPLEQGIGWPEGKCCPVIYALVMLRAARRAAPSKL